ncbi:recombination 2 domain protein [Candidatus Erwinia dacicola]|uniref:Recombination 2 domain protein n=1 Tax=Candidatus Erwinia dacicola TaxID=252393 RepID=A0A328TA74_9GAMM|nr:recombination 2 domain protein [Candidatus Erwinia dacicola]
MFLTVNQLAWSVIAATIPLNFLPQLPGRWASTGLLCLALLLAQLRWAMVAKVGLVLLLFVWSAGSGNTLLENIHRSSPSRWCKFTYSLPVR